MILIAAPHVAGNTRVFSTVLGLSYGNLDGAVLVQDVRVSVEGAGASVFEPKTERCPFMKKRFVTPSSVRGSFTHHVICGMGDPKAEQSNRAGWFLMIW